MTRIACDEALTLMRRALGDDGDGTLPPSLAAHVGECAECAEAWQAQHAIRELLAARAPAPMPAGFAARLDAALDDLTPWWLRVDWRWWTIRLAPAAAALLLLLGGASAGLVPGASGRSAPVTSALVDTTASVSNDSLLLTVLAGSPDDAVPEYEESTR